MRTCARLALAFAIAPAVAALLVGIAMASIRPACEGPTWLAAFWQYFFIACFGSYLISYTAGTLTVVVLKALKKESFLAYTGIGASCGAVYGLYLVSGSAVSIQLFGIFAFVVFISASVAATFATISGAGKKEPNQSPDRTPPSGVGQL
jgi:hypothetical protein